MLELFKRTWLGWNVGVRRFMEWQSAFLMAVAYVVGMGPVAIGLRLARRDLLDRGPGPKDARSYWIPRDGKPMDMERATRQF
ncbi:MAG: hypothetical protein ACOZNI_04795 [Myxococcota bacterium]